MSVKKFKFVSPGIFVNEIDNSHIPKVSAPIGPLVIGRTTRGPAFRPTLVESYSDFIEIFGKPQNGGGSTDLWRSPAGSATAPTYASYAAQAWLANNTPCTVVRVLGRKHADAENAGKAGWWTYTNAGYDTEGAVNTETGEGAYGLFLCDSSSYDFHGTSQVTGTLAAVFYCSNNGGVRLSGSIVSGSTTGEGAQGVTTTGSNAVLIESDGPDSQFTVEIMSGEGVVGSTNVQETLTFNFARTSKKFIRRVANTNPTFVNTGITRTDQRKLYFLGETYETSVGETLSSGSGGSAGEVHGVILGLENLNASAVNWSNKRMDLRAAETPWLFCQNLGDTANYNAAAQTKLFKVVSHESGQYDMHSMKISITDLKASTGDSDPYGTFTLLVRNLKDTDKKQEVLERFSNCNLNPNSPDYIGKRVGTKYLEFDSTSRRVKERGKYNNQSRYIRVEINEDIDSGGGDPELLPWGFHHPGVPKSFSMQSGSTTILQIDTVHSSSGTNIVNEFAQAGQGGVDIYNGHKSAAASTAAVFGMPSSSISTATNDLSASIAMKWPTLRFRKSGSDGGVTFNDQSFFGFDSGKSTSDATFDESVYDMVRPLPAAIVGEQETAGDATFHPFYFTLDDLSGSVDSGDIVTNITQHAVWESGSLKESTNKSIAADSSSADPDGYKRVITAGFNKFTVPMVGGFDGLNIYEKEPIINNQDRATCLGISTTPRELNSYSYNSVQQAVDIVSEVEDLDFNVLTIPGVTQTTLTDKVIEIAEERADALAIIDIENVYTPESENTDSYSSRLGSVKDAVNSLNDRQIDSSYACTYYPWVQAKDTINGNLVYLPPSIAALGAMGSSETASELWFAPAGFNRGGLSNGSAGIPVLNVTEKLVSKDRDKLYEANINPIASFPNEGIVIFGQKTLQLTPSALDRINVRRLMIHVKKEISRMATKVLFDQNVQVTWNRFTSMVEPFLRSVTTRLGLTDFKVVLDTTTTTPDLVDRNVMYAKIFLKPARAIEYIAIDFNITSTGASFED